MAVVGPFSRRPHPQTYELSDFAFFSEASEAKEEGRADEERLLLELEDCEVPLIVRIKEDPHGGGERDHERRWHTTKRRKPPTTEKN